MKEEREKMIEKINLRGLFAGRRKVIDPVKGELAFDNLRLIPHMSLTAFEENFPQEEILTQENRMTPAYGEVTNLYLKPQKSGKDYFALRLFFSREGGLVHLLLSLRDDGSVPTWENWSQERELQKKARNDRWLKKELGEPPYVFPWGSLQSLYDPREASSYIALEYKERRVSDGRNPC